MEKSGKEEATYRKKLSRDSLEKDQLESIIGVQSLSCTLLMNSFIGRGRGYS